MTTLANITTDILDRLEDETGSQDWWTTAEIKGYFNDLYVDILREGGFLRTRDITVVSVVDQQDYDYPSAYNVVSLLSMTYDGKPIYPTTLEELGAYSRTWRAQNSGTPVWYFFEEGREF